MRPFTVWSPDRFLEWQEPPGYRILPEGRLARGQMAGIVGAPGTGKSFVMLVAAVASILGRDCLGIPWREPDSPVQRWLFLGDENSVARVRSDLLTIRNALAEPDWKTVCGALRIQALIEDDDSDVLLATPIALARLTQTIATAFADGPPDNVAFDPLANFADGDLNKGPDMDRVCQNLRRCMREAKATGGLFVLHHGSADAQTIASAVSVNAANYSANSRRFVAKARLIINLFRVDDRLIIAQCGKLNDGRSFPTRCFDFREDPFGVEMPDFDFHEWKEEKMGKNVRSCTMDDVVQAVRGGARKTAEIIAAVCQKTQCSDRAVGRRLKEAREDGSLERVGSGIYALGPRWNGTQGRTPDGQCPDGCPSPVEVERRTDRHSPFKGVSCPSVPTVSASNTPRTPAGTAVDTHINLVEERMPETDREGQCPKVSVPKSDTPSGTTPSRVTSKARKSARAKDEDQRSRRRRTADTTHDSVPQTVTSSPPSNITAAASQVVVDQLLFPEEPNPQRCGIPD